MFISDYVYITIIPSPPATGSISLELQAAVTVQKYSRAPQILSVTYLLSASLVLPTEPTGIFLKKHKTDFLQR